MKLISLLSSGIDSPVATYLMSKKAEEIIILHTDNRPFTDDNEMENFKKLSKQMKNITTCPLKIYIISHGESLALYQEECYHKFTCVFCKRMMLRYAEKIAEKTKANAIIMGDSLGQVASQTLQNIKVIDQAVRIPILRPLIGFDKLEIIKIAKEIGTYQYSILPTSGCGAVPDRPVTQIKLEKILEEEKKLDIKKLIDDAIKNTINIKI